MNTYEHYAFLSLVHDTCMLLVIQFMNTYKQERGLRPALNLGMWYYGAELVHAYMFTYARGQSLRHVVVLASFFATSHRFLQVRIHV